MQGPFGGLNSHKDEKHLTAPAGQTQAAGQQSRGKDAEEDSRKLLEAFARDTGPAADAIAKLLKDPSKEAAEKLLGDIDKLMPSDPAMAAVIAEAMAKEFSGATGVSPVGAVP